MYKLWISTLFLLIATPALAAEDGLFLDPHFSVGYNPAQGTHVLLGLSGGMHLDENLSAGLGAYYSFGEQPAHDREFGVGPFVSYTQPFTSFLVGQLRQEVNYVNLYDPSVTTDVNGNETWSHTEETGVASVTSASLYVFFTRNFVLSGGYRFVLGLSNDALDDGRSGAYVGLSIGF